MSAVADAIEFQELHFTVAVGGPLFRFLKRMGLVDDSLDHLSRRIAVVIAVTWLPLAGLCALAGALVSKPPVLGFVGDVDMHARYLLAVPLLLIAEKVVHIRMQPLVAQFVVRGLVAPAAHGRFSDAVRRAMRLRDSALVEALLLALVYATSVISAHHRYADLFPQSWYSRSGDHGLTPAGAWFEFVSLPLFQFLLFRWYFRLVVWALFLFRVARMPLQLQALHPDKAGGLGFLSQSLNAFYTVAAAHGVIVSSYLADRIFYAGGKLPDFKMEIAAATLVLLTIFTGPLLMFAPKLAAARRAGLGAYGAVAQTYVRTFEAKWMLGGAPPGEPLVGSSDIQSLADLANSYAVAEQMRLAPVTRAAVVRFALAFLTPIAPLLLTVMPVDKLASSVVRLVL